MDLVKFHNEVGAAPDLVGVGVEIGDNNKIKSFIVKHEPTNFESKLPIDVVTENDWETLYGVVTGKREPIVVQHMTRVVGYYSRIENWNPSKIGELGDRHGGDYKVEQK